MLVEVRQHTEVDLCSSKVLSNCSSTYARQPAGQINSAMAASKRLVDGTAGATKNQQLTGCNIAAMLVLIVGSALQCSCCAA
jgi:hypothetical protein